MRPEVRDEIEFQVEVGEGRESACARQIELPPEAMGDYGAAAGGAAVGTPVQGLAGGVFEPGAGAEGQARAAGASGTPAAGFKTPGAGAVSGETPGTGGSYGATPGSLRAPAKTPGSGVLPSQRWVIYYDKNGNELQRKMKGPGRLPRGAYLDDNHNYIVRDCIVNKNTQEVMTVPTYIPEKKHERTGRAEAEQFVGFDFLAANPMAAPMGVARLPTRAARIRNDGAPDEENPYAKFRGGMG